MDNNDSHKPNERLEGAYHAMMQRVQEALSRADDGVDTLNQALRHARDTAVNLGELSREEAARVSDWVQRDMQDAGSYLARTGHELRDWLHMDLELIEYSLLDLLTSVADKTRLEMLQFEEDLSHQGEYHSGEIAGPGTLECRECGEQLHFKQAGHIPPCPRCHGTSFGRKSR